MGDLSTNLVYARIPDDYKVSNLMQEYFANFIKNGNPNGKNLPEWNSSFIKEPVYFMRLGVNSALEMEKHRARYLFLDKF